MQTWTKIVVGDPHRAQHDANAFLGRLAEHPVDSQDTYGGLRAGTDATVALAGHAYDGTLTTVVIMITYRSDRPCE